jgi:hypothetical protein
LQLAGHGHLLTEEELSDVGCDGVEPRAVRRMRCYCHGPISRLRQRMREAAVFTRSNADAQRGTPKRKAATEKDYRFETMGVLTFMVTMVALQVLATPGSLGKDSGSIISA